MRPQLIPMLQKGWLPRSPRLGEGATKVHPDPFDANYRRVRRPDDLGRRRVMVANVMDTDTSVGALLFWAMTALTCIERVLLEEDFSPWHRRLSDRPSTLTKQSDAALTLLALRNVLRAAEWCARDLQRPTSDPMDWIAAFHRMVPDLINARDALEHFDEYAIGRGRLQRATAEPFSFSFSVGPEGPLVNVGRFSIRMQAAKEACKWLPIKLLAAVERDPSREARAEALLDEVLTEQTNE